MRYGGLLFKEEKSSKGLLLGTKVVFFWSDFYETWSSRKIGDTAYQQTFLCCTAHLVWLVLGAREISLWPIPAYSSQG